MAVVCVTPQAGISSSSIVSLLDESWCFASFFGPSRVPAASPTLAGGSAHAKFTVSSRPLVGSEGTPQSSCTAVPAFRATDECSAAGRSGMDECSEGAATIGRSHSVGEAELRRVFESFDDNADGLVRGDELRRFMSLWGMDISETDASSIITSVDHNRDGGIDFDEFYSLYHTKPMGLEDSIEAAAGQEDSQVLTAAFRMFDKNQDGFISAQELQAILAGLGQSAGRSLKQCQRMIATVDRDGNGLCDIHEFEQMMSSRQF